MKWVRFTEKQRDFIADKLMDTANGGVVILALGQLVQQEVNLLALVLGILLYLLFWVLAIRLKRG
ncbi:MAG: hypothetical protein JNM70_20145 [Anaerolineae bacterium]|nr:hypothetical protein [Anaerolineae bacterium]